MNLRLQLSYCETCTGRFLLKLLDSFDAIRTKAPDRLWPNTTLWADVIPFRYLPQPLRWLCYLGDLEQKSILFNLLTKNILDPVEPTFHSKIRSTPHSRSIGRRRRSTRIICIISHNIELIIRPSGHIKM